MSTRFYSLVCVLAIPGLLAATTGPTPSPPPPAPAHRPLPVSTVAETDFYFLSLLRDDPAVRQSPDLKTLGERKRQALSAASSVDAIVQAARWSDAEIATVAQALPGLLAPTRVAERLRASGLLVREQSLSDADLIARAWTAEAAGVNHALDVYGLGKPPFYPKIDSITADPKSPEWGVTASRLARMAAAADGSFVTPSVDLTVSLMAANHRDESARFEPMATGENKAAVDRLPTIDWSHFQYSCILVPGIGPEVPDQPLSPGGKANVELAAAAFKARRAPYLLVSGGYVHPNQTRFCEAIEMRRELIDHLGIPADAILIDPHARHTTTNLRNANRLIYRYGLPFDKPVLITCNARAITGIAAPAFARRCARELGYVPMKIGEKPSATEVAYWPQIESLEEDPMAPLDP